MLGPSKGAEAALLLGATYPERLKAVVAYWPSAVVWQGVTIGDPTATYRPPTSSWTLGGQSVPFIRIPPPQITDFVELRPVTLPFWPFVMYAPSFRYPVAREAYDRAFELARLAGQLPQTTIPVERINGPVLLVSSTEDLLWDSPRFSEMVLERLRDHGHPHDDRHLCYEGAGHLTSLPFSVSITAKEGPFIHGGSLGGSVEANGHLVADFWAQVLEFLSKHLG